MVLAPPDQDVEMFSGDTKTLVLLLKDANGLDVDPNGAVARWGAYVYETDELKIEKPVEIDVVNRKGKVKLYPPDTANLRGNYYHELEITDFTGTVVTVIQGAFIVKKDLVL